MKFLALLLLTLFGTTFAWPSEFSPFLARAPKGGEDKAKNGTAHQGNRNGTSGNSVKKQCAQIQALTRLTDLANNATKLQALEDKGKLNATEVQAIKDKAANATSKLQTMTSNSTLMSECAVVDASQKVKAQCKAMKELTKLVDLSKNSTAMKELETKKNLNDTQIAKFQERIGNASTKLQEMQSNTTLVDTCASLTKNAKNSSSTASGTAAAAKSTSNAASSLQMGSGASFGLSTLLVGVIAAML